MNKQEIIYKRLDDLGLKYRVENHKAVFTIDEYNKLNLSTKGNVVKNLFLRDAKGKRYFLVVLHKDKKVDLKELRAQLSSTALSFASEKRLDKYLKLTKGSVTPLGVINNNESNVEVVFDKDIAGDKILGVHPNINTATLWISFKNLEEFIHKNGNKIKYVNI